MKLSRLKLLIGLSVPALLATWLLCIGRSPTRPRPIFRPRGELTSLEISPQGQLFASWSCFSGAHSFDCESVLETADHRLSYERKFTLEEAIDPTSRLAAPLPDRGRVVPGNRPNTLAMISPEGKVKSHKLFSSASKEQELVDLRFLPSTGEILALTRDTLWRLDLEKRKPPRAVRVHPGKFLSPARHELLAWAWDSSSMWGKKDASISPDGKYIAGFHQWAENAFLDIFDSTTGSVLRHIRLTANPAQFLVLSESRVKWIGDGEYILIEKAGLHGVQCIAWRTGKVVRRFAWPTEMGLNIIYQRRFLSPDNRLYCDIDSHDIVLRDSLSGKIMRRANQAIPTGFLPDHLAVAQDGGALYFQPVWRSGTKDKSIWRWPTVAE